MAVRNKLPILDFNPIIIYPDRINNEIYIIMLPLHMFNEAWISIKSNKLRSFLTILGVLIGVCSLILMITISQAVRKRVNRELEWFGGNVLLVNPKSLSRGGIMSRKNKSILSYEDYKAIKEIKNVKNAVALCWAEAQVIYNSHNWETYIRGSTPGYFNMWFYELEDGDIFTEEDVENAANYIVIGQTVVRNLFGEDENPIGAVVRINNVPFTVIGILKGRGFNMQGYDEDDVIVMPLFSLTRRLVRSKFANALERIMVDVDDVENIEYVKDQIEILLQERHNIMPEGENDFEIMNLKEMKDQLDNIAKTFSLLLISVATISLITGSIGIMNMMLMSVTERTQEIGIRRAIGAKDNDILMQFIFESVLLSMIGGFVGMSIGVVISQVGGYFLGYDVPFDAVIMVLSVFVAILVGVAVNSNLKCTT